MLDNFIRGGQLFIHNLTMFKQVLYKALLVSFVVSIVTCSYYSWPKLKLIDHYAASTYLKARFAEWVHQNRVILHQNAKMQVPKVNIIDHKGIQQREVPASSILKSRKFKKAYEDILMLLERFVKAILASTIALMGIFFLLWSSFGRAAKETKLLKGGRILDVNAAKKILKKKKLASDLNICSLPLVKDSETRHILVSGTTGSGKTNCLHHLLPQIRKRKDPAIVVDLDGSLFCRYFRPDRDILINPFDERSFAWDFWSEVETTTELETFTSFLFAQTSQYTSEVTHLFSEWAGMFFSSSMQYLKDSKQTSTKALYEMIHLTEPAKLVKKLQDTPAAAIMDLANEKNITAHNIRASTIARTKWLKVLNEEGSNPKISLKNWFQDIDLKKDQWIFLTAASDQASILRPMISLLLSLAASNLKAQQENLERRFWFVLDELAALDRLSFLEDSLTGIRKYGGCILAALQDYEQFFSKYGSSSAKTMISQFATNILFRMPNLDMAQVFSKKAGEVEYLGQQKNTSYGAHEMRDGISYSEQERRRPVLPAQALTSLQNLEAVILLPDPDVLVSKVQTTLVERPTKSEVFFQKKETKEVV